VSAHDVCGADHRPYFPRARLFTKVVDSAVQKANITEASEPHIVLKLKEVASRAMSVAVMYLNKFGISDVAERELVPVFTSFVGALFASRGLSPSLIVPPNFSIVSRTVVPFFRHYLECVSLTQGSIMGDEPFENLAKYVAAFAQLAFSDKDWTELQATVSYAGALFVVGSFTLYFDVSDALWNKALCYTS
jgi:hypothetical protein